MKKTISSVLPTLLLTLAVVGATPLAQAQAVANATITGRVVDTQGAVINDAQVTATSTETGAVRTITTNGEGLYTLGNLPVGAYSFEVTAPGFQKYSQKGVELRVGDNIQIAVTMTIGAASETVEVEGNTSMVQTQQNSFSQVIDQRRIVDLPLNGRDPTALITLSGGAVNKSDGTNTGSKSSYGAVSIAVAGGQGNQTNYLLDGGDHNDSFTNVNLVFPFPDALQEFSVESNSLPARNGLHPGGLVNVVTKSGSNQWHGSFFEFLRNYKLNAINYFAQRQDSLKRNQFGGTFGGRIISDKLFFFYGYQMSRIRQDPANTSAFVPTAAALAGDFSALDGPGCTANKPRALKDPTTGVLLTPGNPRVNPSTYDPASLALVKYLPTPINDCGLVYYGTPVHSNDQQHIGRVDYNISNKHQIFGRYFYDEYLLAAYFDPKNILVTTTSGNAQRVQSFTLGDTYAIKPNLVNSFHFTFSRRRINRGPNATGINASNLGVNNVYQGTNNYLQVSVTNGGFSVGSGTGALGIFNINSFQEADDIDWTRGKHSFAMGVDVIRTQDNVNSHYEDNGWFQFSNIYSAYTPPTGTACPSGYTCGTGDPLLDFLAGKMNKYEQTMPQQNAYRQTVFGLYAQDTWRLTPKLVMNIGLRWEPTTFPHDVFNRGSVFRRAGFDAGTRSTVFPNAPAGMYFYGDPGVPQGFTTNSLNNFSPRLGFVYNPDGQGRTTIRVGSAYLYDTLGTYLTYRVTANNLPYGITVSNASGPYQFSNPWNGVPGGNPFPLPFNPPKSFVFPLGAAQVVLPENFHPVTVGQWNIGMQHQFGRNWVASVSYLGNKTSHMMLGNEVNPAVYIPGTWTGPGSCGALTISPGAGKPCSATSNTQARRLLNLTNPGQGQYYGQQSMAYDKGFADYHGMLASLEHRFANNYTILANYTFSRCRAVGPITSIGVEGVIQNPYNPRSDYGPCSFDAPHIFNLSGVVLSNWAQKGSWSGRLLNGWKLAPLFRYQTGTPVNPLTGVDNSLTGIGQDRPNVTGVDPYTGNPRTSANYRYLTSSAYTANPLGTFGNAVHFSLRQPRYIDMDASFSRIFDVYERLKLEARFEAFNALNHPNLNGPNATLSSASFGQITSAQDPRILQAAVKFTF